MSNFLLDSFFLKKLFEEHNKETYVKLLALDKNELPIEEIEGLATGGTINLDGSSAVRRSCSLSMVAKTVNIHDYYWGLKNKFRLKIGLKNTIDSQYPEICWFDYGVFVIYSFSCSLSTNNYSISIVGKDKLSLLNGEIAGNFYASTVLSKMQVQNDFGDVVQNTLVPVKEIIKNLLVSFGGESIQNVNIQDLDGLGIQYLKYQANEKITGEEGENTE